MASYTLKAWQDNNNIYLFRYHREGYEDAFQYTIGEGDTALEQIHEQHLRAAE